MLIVDFENLYPDGTTSPSDGARYLRETARPARSRTIPPWST